MHGWIHDLALAWRTLRQRPLTSLVIVATMAVGIGANVGAFAYYSYFARPTMDAPEPSRVFWVNRVAADGSEDTFGYRDWRELEPARRAVFSEDTAFRLFSASIQGPDRTLHTYGTAASGGYFSFFGERRAHLGRLLGPSDDAPGAEPVMVLSHLTWVRHFDRDPGILGKNVLVDGIHPYTVVGVARSGFQGQGIWTGVYLPLSSAGRIVARNDEADDGFVSSLGRLAPAVSLETARERLQRGAEALDEARPSREPRRLRLDAVTDPRNDFDPDDPVSIASRILMAAVALLLLLACANVANLLLAQGVARRREMGVHAALGAGRWRVARRLFLEALTLSLVGGALGLFLSRGLLRLAVHYLRQEIPVSMGEWGAGTHLVVNESEVAAYFVAVAVVTALLFGLAPVLQTVRLDVVGVLKGERPGEGRRWQARDLLVVGQLALSVVLLIGATLLGRTLLNLRAGFLGFETRGLYLASVYMPKERLRGEAANAGVRLYDEIVERVRALPDVRDASLAWRVPLSYTSEVPIEVGPGGERLEIHFNVVGDGYFATLGVPVLAGRAFDRRDRSGSPRSLIVNRTAAERLWPDRDPLGQTLVLHEDGYDEPGEPWQVAGVVADSRYDVPWQALGPHLYLPFRQRPYPRMTVMMRASSTAPRAVEKLLRADYPDLAVMSLVPFAKQMEHALAIQRMNAEIAGGLGLLGLLLALLGIWSVMGYTVSQRQKEIGIRVAVGARAADVRRWVLGLAGRQVAAGLLLGVAAALAVVRVLEGLLQGVEARDPATFVLVPLVLGAAALAAAWLPARRAARVDPIRALRQP